MREAHQNFLNSLNVVLIAVLVVTLGRALAIYPLSLVFNRSKLKLEKNHQHILFWGGLRGALALALALGLPEELQYREQIITAAFGVVAFSIFVQGLTMTPLLRRLQVLPSPSHHEQPPVEEIPVTPKAPKRKKKAT